MRHKVYLAGPLFTLAERRFNQAFAVALKERLADAEIILPQEEAKKYMQMQDGLERIFQDCISSIDAATIIVAILDGPDSDSGTCIELGYAFSKRKPIVGIRTDFRGSEDRGLNLMVSHICTHLVLNSSANLEELAGACAVAIEGLG